MSVPRVLLRNGEKDRATFESSQVSTDVLMDEPTSVEQSSLPETLQTVPPLPREEFAMSMVMKELNLMKNEIRALKYNLCFKSYSKLGCCSASRGNEHTSNDYTYHS